jgi:hypothetical protein
VNLRTLAESDLAAVLEDDVYGFGWPISVTNPAGVVASGLVGSSQDISQIIDPDTGQAVSGRLATVVLRISSLSAVGIPAYIADEAGKPWVIIFDDINGNAHAFKVAESNPDRTIGVVVCILEAYLP